jgi:hypothetical protein
MSIDDRTGWPILEGARVRVRERTIKGLTSPIEGFIGTVLSVEEGVIEIRELSNGATRHAHPSDCRVMGSAKKKTFPEYVQD